MAWSSPRTWVTGETVTATHMNTHIRDNLNAGFPDAVSVVSWSAILSGTTSGSLAANSARRFRIGSLQFLWADFIFTSVPVGTFTVALPVAASGVSTSITNGQTIGDVITRDISTGANSRIAVAYLRTSTVAGFRLDNGSNVDNTTPFTWATASEGGPDVLTFHAVYPIA